MRQLTAKYVQKEEMIVYLTKKISQADDVLERKIK